MTNPLSVKTKVHVPRSPSAQLSAKERTKVFLEVHIQNLTPEPMWFERIMFEPALGWDVQDVNLLPDGQHTLFSGPMAMMQPQDTRQYLYVLNETNPPSIPTQYAPGTVLPLGRLDISWRSSFGEPGRLLTSVSVFVEFRRFFQSISINITDAVASNPNSAKSTTSPSTATTAYVCSPASSPAINHNYWPFPPSALTLKHPTSRRSSALSFFLAFPQPSDVRPTTATTESLDLCRSRHSSTYRRRGASGPAG